MKKKLILFDIDGTLILTGGVAANLMAEAVSQVLGMPVQWSLADFIGNTDRRIIFTLLHRNGAPDSLMNDMMEKALGEYLKNLRGVLRDKDVVQILPGVLKLLDTLKSDDRFALGLLTGNLLEGSQLKLEKDNLFDYFPIGGFGDDAFRREDLPPIVLQRAEKYYGHFFERKNVWIVGDSVMDIKCAHVNRICSLAVASGHTPHNELQSHNPTSLLPDLRQTDKVVRIFLSE